MRNYGLAVCFLAVLLGCSPPHSPGPDDENTGTFVRYLSIQTTDADSGFLISNYNYIHSSHAMTGQSNMNGEQIIRLHFSFNKDTAMKVIAMYPNDSVKVVNLLNENSPTNELEINNTPFVYYDSNSLHIRIEDPVSGKVIFDATW